MVSDVSRMVAWVRVAGSSSQETRMEAGRLVEDSPAFDVAASGEEASPFQGSAGTCVKPTQEGREGGGGG